MEQENLVYHYTSLKTLFNIIDNQSFWLTDLRSSMDKNEMVYAEKLIKNTGKKLLALEIPLYSSAKNYYALSCTRNVDNYMHFKAYGDDCYGVAIGINTKFIEDSMPTINCATMLHYHLFFDNVSYDDEEYQKYIIERYLQMKRTIDKSNDRKLSDAYNSYL